MCYIEYTGCVIQSILDVLYRVYWMCYTEYIRCVI